MTLEQYLATLIVASSFVSSAFAMVAIVLVMNVFMDEAEATERRRRGARPDAWMDGVEEARVEDPARAAALRVFRVGGSMYGNTRRGR
jgi:hypothetical protein